MMQESRAVDLTSAKILIVDDMPANLALIYKSLCPEPYQVLAVTDGCTAIEVVRQEKPDLVLLDVMLPDMDGYEVCRVLKADQDTADIPVIFISGQGEAENVALGFQVGGVDYVIKPFQKEELLIRIRTQLERLFLARAFKQI